MPHVGIHRGLGVHISKVRSCTLDTWLPEQVAFMARTGNARANAHYEARLPAGAKPSYYSPELEAFTRRKVSPGSCKAPMYIGPVINMMMCGLRGVHGSRTCQSAQQGAPSSGRQAFVPFP